MPLWMDGRSIYGMRRVSASVLSISKVRTVTSELMELKQSSNRRHTLRLGQLNTAESRSTAEETLATILNPLHEDRRLGAGAATSDASLGIVIRMCT